MKEMNKKSQGRMSLIIVILMIFSLTLVVIALEQGVREALDLQGTYTTNTNALSIPLSKDLAGYKGYFLRVQGKGDGELKDNILYLTNIQGDLSLILTLFYKSENIINRT
ncbi:MAG: hypothetical protein ABIH37_04975 [archaeon]